MFASPVAGRSFIGRGLAVVAGPEIGAAFRVFVLPKVLVITVTISHFADLVTLFPQHHELFGGPLGCLLGFVETGEGLPHVFDLSGRESLEPFLGHNQK